MSYQAMKEIDFINRRREKFFSEFSTNDWDYLTRWIAKQVGRAVTHCIEQHECISYLCSQLASRKGKTSYAKACANVRATAKSFYSKTRAEVRGYREHVYKGTSAERDFITNIKTIQESKEDKAKRLRQNFELCLNPMFKEASESILYYRSPYKFPVHPVAQTRDFLEGMFLPDDLLFIAPRVEMSKTLQPSYIKPASVCASFFPQFQPGYPIETSERCSSLQYITPCTFTGNPNAEGSYISGDCRQRVDYMVVEFDDVPLVEQRRYWLGVIDERKIPVCALIFSGNKSYHAWIRIPDNLTLNDSDDYISNAYRHMFAAIGADESKKGKGTRVRLPGSIRRDKETGAVLHTASGAPTYINLVYWNRYLAVGSKKGSWE